MFGAFSAALARTSRFTTGSGVLVGLLVPPPELLEGVLVADWLTGVFVAAGIGVLVAAGTGVFVAAGTGVFVAAGTGVFVAGNTGVFSGSGVGVKPAITTDTEPAENR